MENDQKINCPNCGTSIDVQAIISHRMEEDLRKKLNEEALQWRKNQEQKLREQLKAEDAERMESIRKELEEKSEQLRDLNKSKAEVEKLRREKLEMEDRLKLENERRLNEILTAEREKIRKTESERNELRLKEMQKKLDDQVRLTEEMKRRQEQGSMQLQGEAQELAIEEWLRAQFPLDTIEEIKKGVRGGDCVQIINTRAMQNCGTIYYESKRTKTFGGDWLDKFRQDIRDRKASIGVLVTEAMPSGMDRMGMKEGIWICSFEEFKGLCSVLRESVIQLHHALSTQENKGDKMQMLYSYLTSNTFRMQVEAIVEGFTQMKTDLDTEKRAMQKLWAQREKQIDKVLLNTSEMYGSVKGIAGNAIGNIPSLELPGSDEPEA
ncbi:MAG: DUF2130 domain-containing protein [Bacteroidia bacterium]|nr:DUF2130 domain-containing protein [Bacteroidia bacterium]